MLRRVVAIITIMAQAQASNASASATRVNVPGVPLKNLKRPTTQEPVHVVYSSTDGMIAVVEASVRSVKAHASGPVKFYYIGNSPLPSMPDVKFISLSKVSKKYRLKDFINIADRGDDQNAINSMHANYARFVLDSLVPKKSKAMYLDADTIVLCDVVELINSVLNDETYVVAAVPRSHIFGLTEKGDELYGHIQPSFNAGVYVKGGLEA